jgi:hypothetical protein
MTEGNRRHKAGPFWLEPNSMLSAEGQVSSRRLARRDTSGRVGCRTKGSIFRKNEFRREWALNCVSV